MPPRKRAEPPPSNEPQSPTPKTGEQRRCIKDMLESFAPPLEDMDHLYRRLDHATVAMIAGAITHATHAILMKVVEFEKAMIEAEMVTTSGPSADGGDNDEDISGADIQELITKLGVTPPPAPVEEAS